MQQVPAVDQKTSIFHGHIACHLFHPLLIRTTCDAGQAYPPALQMNEKQHVVRDQPCASSQSCPAVKSTTSQGSPQSRSAITWLPCLTCFGSGSEPRPRLGALQTLLGRDSLEPVIKGNLGFQRGRASFSVAQFEIHRP